MQDHADSAPVRVCVCQCERKLVLGFIMSSSIMFNDDGIAFNVVNIVSGVV